MTLNLTAEQEERIQAIIQSGAYRTVEDVVEAAIAVVEQRATQSAESTGAELEALLLAGMDSPELPEDQFWASVGHATDSMLAEHKVRARP